MTSDQEDDIEMQSGLEEVSILILTVLEKTFLTLLGHVRLVVLIVVKFMTIQRILPFENDITNFSNICFMFACNAAITFCWWFKILVTSWTSNLIYRMAHNMPFHVVFCWKQFVTHCTGKHGYFSSSDLFGYEHFQNPTSNASACTIS